MPPSGMLQAPCRSWTCQTWLWRWLKMLMVLPVVLQIQGCTLRELDLSKNLLGNAAAEAMGDMLAASNTLQRLDLSWNKIKVQCTPLLGCKLPPAGFAWLARTRATVAVLICLLMQQNLG